MTLKPSEYGIIADLVLKFSVYIDLVFTNLCTLPYFIEYRVTLIVGNYQMRCLHDCDILLFMMSLCTIHESIAARYN
ncbi:hypothetical protein DFP97_108133 [Paenibacillus prosopidis]|uniref:Uncharacterized protein n=1 Tax=Paenibacillus prosopidis TaxID=630520 RepID=A0A368W2M4_9BACL|nr:hypothetical protein DFP97_108133 [Paenibacillus prosopidis]